MSRKADPVAEALGYLRRATGQVSAVRRALEQSVEESMAAPGGEEWEHQVSEPEQEELVPQGPEPTPTPWEAAHKRAWQETFRRNWANWRRRRRERR